MTPFDKILVEEMENDDLHEICNDIADDDILDMMAESLSPREETLELFPQEEGDE